MQNRRQEVFIRGALRLCRGDLILKSWLNLQWFVVFHISIWVVSTLFGGLSPPKPPPVATGLGRWLTASGTFLRKK